MVCKKTIGAMKYEIKKTILESESWGFCGYILIIMEWGSVVGVRTCIRKSGIPLQLH